MAVDRALRSERERADDRLPAESAPGPLRRLSWWVFWWLVAPPVRLLFRIRCVDLPDLPGPCVIVANHASHLDPLLLGAGLPRRITFLMTVLHFRSARLGWFFRWQRVIPLEVRGLGNRAALRAAKAVLERGELLTIFPEGAVTRDGGMYLGNPGAVSLALANDVPILPCFIDGAREAAPIGGKVRLRPITLRFGEPLDHERLFADATDRRDRLRRATRILMDRIAELGGVTSREVELESAPPAGVPQA